MSASNWYNRNAHWIIVITLVGVMTTVGYFVLVNSAYEQGYKDANTSSESGESKRKLYESCLGIGERQKVLDCLEEKIEPYRTNQRSEEDLKAQKDMANWAFGALIATVFFGSFTVVMTGIGLFFLRDTLAANAGMHQQAIRA